MKKNQLVNRRQQRKRNARNGAQRQAAMHTPTIFQCIQNDLHVHNLPYGVSDRNRAVHVKCRFFPPEETAYCNSDGDAEVELELVGDEAAGKLTVLCRDAWDIGTSPDDLAKLNVALASYGGALRIHFAHQLRALSLWVTREFNATRESSDESLRHMCTVLRCITALDAAFRYAARTGNVPAARLVGEKVFNGTPPAETRIAELSARLIEQDKNIIQRVTDYFTEKVSPFIDAHGLVLHGPAGRMLERIQARLSNPYGSVAVLVSGNTLCSLSLTLTKDFESETIAWIDALLEGGLDEKAS